MNLGSKNFMMLFLQLLLIVFISMLFSLLISAGIMALFDSNNMVVMKSVQGIVQIFTFMLPAIFFLKINKVEIKSFLGFDVKLPWKITLLSFLLFAAVIPMVDWLMIVNDGFVFPEWMSGFEARMQSMQKMNEELIIKFLSVNNIGALLFNIFIIALIPAIGEELIFRGVLQKLLVNKMRSAHLAIIITSVIFSALHFEFYAFLPRIILGMVLGYTFYYTGNIIIPMLIHFINNAVSVVTYYYHFNYINNGEPLDTLNTSSYSNIYYALISLAVSAVILYLIIRQFKNNNQTKILDE